MSSTSFTTSIDQRGVFTARLDVTDRAQNVFTPTVVQELSAIVDQVESDPSLHLVVFRSGKDSGFLAGADVEQISEVVDSDQARAISHAGQELFGRIERLSVPTLAVIHGPCLGGGLEFALACRYRVARDDASTRLGQPEVELGILPGWGGTLRLPRQVGLTTALPMILTGKRLSARDAARCGLIDEAPAAGSWSADVEAFIDGLLAGRSPRRPGNGLLKWLADRTPPGRWLVLRTAQGKTRRHADHYPAPDLALTAIRQGLRSAEAGLAAERAAIAELLFTPTCRNLVGLFFQRERARAVTTWVSDNSTPSATTRVGVVGAGVMGAGIAQLAAHTGADVVLRDISDELIQQGRERIVGAWDKLVSRGRLSPADRDQRVDRLTTTTDAADLSDVDIVIEAVTEREEIKRTVFSELDPLLPPEAILATNTSALSVTRLAEVTGRADRVAGLHFFNPVHRMPLVEIITTDTTSSETLSRLVTLVRGLGKTPLRVADQPGFLVNRVLAGYLDEAVRLVCEGHSVEKIDKSMRSFGMPMGPLQLLDQIGLDVALHVASGTTDPSDHSGPTPARLEKMVEEGLFGVKTGAGFYRYRRGKPVGPTPGPGPREPARFADDEEALAHSWPAPVTATQLRLVLPLINTAAECLEANVVSEPWMVDLGMVLGTGFAPFRGGPLKLADTWGTRTVVSALQRLADVQGPRFAPCPLLTELAARTDGRFHTDA